MARNRFLSATKTFNTRRLVRTCFRPFLEVLETRLAPATWDGGGADANWMTPANWVGDVAPLPGDSLTFPGGAAQTTNNNNFPAGTGFNGLIFSGGYSISGNGITLTKGIATSAADFVNLPVALAAGQAFTASGSGYLFLLGQVNTNGFQLRTDVIDSATMQFTFDSTITGTGSVWKTGPGTVIINGDNSFSGGTTLSEGGLAVGQDTSLGTGTLTLKTATIGPNFGNRSIANPVILSGNPTIGGSGSLDILTFTGPVTLTANRTINVPSIFGTFFTGPIGESGGSFKLSKTGFGQLLLTGNNTFSGGLTISGQGMFAAGSNSAAGTGTLTFNGGGIRAEGAARTLANPVIINGTTNIGGSLALTFRGTVTLTANRTINVNNTGLTTYFGAIGESGGSFKLGKGGEGTLVLAAANTFSGGLTINAGTLALGNNSALGVGNLTIWHGTIRAEGAARTLSNSVAINSDCSFGGTNNLTLTGSVVLNNGTRTITFSNTALTTFSGPVSGDGMIKLGNGTLILTGNNTYASTTIFAGTVEVDGLQPTSIVVVNPSGTLTGSGTVGAVTMHAGAFLSPGPGTAILHTGGVEFVADPSVVMSLNAPTAGAGYDQLQVTGLVSLGGTASLNISLGFTPSVGTSFTIIDNDGDDAVSGNFNGLTEGATFALNGFLFQISYVGGTGNDVVLTRIA